MRSLNNLEFEICYRIEELIVKHGLMSIHDPRVARLFKNLAAIRKLKQSLRATTEHIGHEGAKGYSRQTPAQ